MHPGPVNIAASAVQGQLSGPAGLACLLGWPGMPGWTGWPGLVGVGGGGNFSKKGGKRKTGWNHEIVIFIS